MKILGMVIFELDGKEVKQVFKEIKKILSASKLWKISTRVEITVKDGQIQLVGNGFTKVISSFTTGTCKLTVPIFHWYQLVEMSTEKTLKVVATDGEAMVGKVSVKVLTTFFETDKILRSISLPANPRAIDYWKLQYQGYTPEELEFNQLIVQIDSANKEFNRSIRKAAELFSEFCISEKDMREMVISKLSEREKINFEK